MRPFERTSSGLEPSVNRVDPKTLRARRVITLVLGLGTLMLFWRTGGHGFILLDDAGYVRLVDFDLARPKPDKPKKVRKNPGTPAYMAPEQLLREPFDHRADIFACGVTAYEVLTGQKPFAGDTPEEIFRSQLNREGGFRAPRELNPEIPPAVEKTILKCLERDPDKRHPIISVLVVELKAALYV